MCIKCLIKEAAAAAAGAQLVKKVVGTVAPEFLAEMNRLKEAEKQLDVELDAELETVIPAINAEIGKTLHTVEDLHAALDKGRDELVAKYDKKAAELEDLQHKAWKAALTSAGIDLEKQAGDYGINRHTGLVTMDTFVKIKVEDVPVAEGVQ